jgi:hypothetical protein
MSAPDLTIIVIWLVVMFLGVWDFSRAMRNALATLHARQRAAWDDLGGLDSLWDVVWRDREKGFRRFVSDRRYSALQDEGVEAAFAAFVLRRNIWIVVWTTASLGVTFILRCVN